MTQRKERRRAPRSFSSIPLDLCDPKSHAVIGEGRFLNMSMTGSLMVSRQTLPVNKPIQLLLQNPGKSPFELAGKVVWRKKKASVFNYGIQFKSSLSRRSHHPVQYKEVA
jgi:hypothetical protein